MYCQQEDHFKFPCVGFCLNKDCERRGQRGCELCLVRMHLSHYHEFIRMEDISKRLNGATDRNGIERRVQDVDKTFQNYRDQMLSKLDQYQSHLKSVLTQFIPILEQEDICQKQQLTSEEMDRIMMNVKSQKYVQELQDVDQIFLIYQNQIKSVLKHLSSFHKETVIIKAKHMQPEDFSSDKPFIQSYYHKMRKHINTPEDVLIIRGIPLDRPILYKNGDQYEGEVLNHKLHGRGTLIEKDGSIYTGVFKRGTMVYGASFKWVDSDESNPYAVMSMGYMQNKLVEGQGVQYFSDNSRYVGQLQAGMKHGSGKYFQPIEIVEHESRGGVKEEESMEQNLDGTVYEGDWLNDLQDGKGVIMYPDKSKFVGFFKAGRKDGFGILYLPDGRRLEGKYQNDLREGEHQVIGPGNEKLQTKIYEQGYDINRINHKKIKVDQDD